MNLYRKNSLLVLACISTIVLLFAIRQLALIEIAQPIKDVYVWTFVKWLYPNIDFVLKEFGQDFILNKIDQLMIRVILLMLLFWAIYFNQSFRSKLISPKEFKVNHLNLVWWLWGGYQLLVFYEYYAMVNLAMPMRSFFQPFAWGVWLSVPFPSSEVLYIVYSIANVLVLIFLFSNYFVKFYTSIAICLIHLVFQQWYFGFGKYDYSFVTLTLIAALIPFFIYEIIKYYKNNFVKENIQHRSFILNLIQWMIVLPYFFSGIEKLLTGGIAFIDFDQSKLFFLQHPTDIGTWLLNYPLLVSILLLLVLVFQVTFPVVMIVKKFLIYYLIGGIIFHIGIYIVLDVGHYLHPWYVMYIFFIPSMNQVVATKKIVR